MKNLEFKVGLLLTLTVILAAAFLAYALYARGVFEPTQKLILNATEAEGVTIGQPITFSGFPIGEVTRLDLAPDGKVKIEISILKKDAKWLRKSSVFTLEKSIVGGAKIKAHSEDMSAPALEPGAVRDIYTGDAAQDIPVILARVKEILTNVADMTGKEAPINRTLGSVATVTGRMGGEYGVLEGVLGTPDKAKHVVDALQKANSLLANVNGISLKVDGMLGKTDAQVFGDGGVLPNARESVVKINGMLGEVRESLKKADSLLASANTATANVAVITGNVKDASADMAALRVEIDDSVRKVNHLINEINKKWPFARDVEIRTP
ncbi:MAG: MCE family protein [Betaproteobacteria bacterium]|nr:MCE family protein [Betaproteobacteria bacterium]